MMIQDALELFVTTWNGGESLDAVAATLGMTPTRASAQAHTLRKRGVPLKRFWRSIDFDRLRTLATTVFDEKENAQGETADGLSVRPTPKQELLRLVLFVEAGVEALWDEREDGDLSVAAQALADELPGLDRNDVVISAAFSRVLEAMEIES